MEAVRALRGVDLDFVGFILAPSKRQVSLSQLTELTKAVPPGIKKVGVWVNPALSEVVEAVEQARLDVVQLHGQESPSFCEKLKQACSVEIIKTFHVGEEETALPNDAYGATIDYMLLDTYDPRLAGGTGKAFQWGKIEDFRRWCQAHDAQLIVAGGITPENIEELLERHRLDGVDVANGVETEGKKDQAKIKIMAEKVKRYDNSAK